MTKNTAKYWVIRLQKFVNTEMLKKHGHTNCQWSSASRQWITFTWSDFLLLRCGLWSWPPRTPLSHGEPVITLITSEANNYLVCVRITNCATNALAPISIALFFYIEQHQCYISTIPSNIMMPLPVYSLFSGRSWKLPPGISTLTPAMCLITDQGLKDKEEDLTTSMPAASSVSVVNSGRTEVVLLIEPLHLIVMICNTSNANAKFMTRDVWVSDVPMLMPLSAIQDSSIKNTGSVAIKVLWLNICDLVHFNWTFLSRQYNWCQQFQRCHHRIQAISPFHRLQHWQLHLGVHHMNSAMHTPCMSQAPFTQWMGSSRHTHSIVASI